MEVWQFGYFFISLSSFAVAYIFYRTQNGLLRKLMILHFFSLGVSSGLILVDFIMVEYFFTKIPNNVLRIIASSPLLLTLLILWGYLHKNYFPKNKETRSFFKRGK